MAWFSGRVSLGNFADIAGAVNKLQESVKNIEKNFDSALGFEEKSESSSDGNYTLYIMLQLPFVIWMNILCTLCNLKESSNDSEKAFFCLDSLLWND